MHKAWVPVLWHPRDMLARSWWMPSHARVRDEEPANSRQFTDDGGHESGVSGNWQGASCLIA